MFYLWFSNWNGGVPQGYPMSAMHNNRIGSIILYQDRDWMYNWINWWNYYSELDIIKYRTIVSAIERWSRNYYFWIYIRLKESIMACCKRKKLLPQYCSEYWKLIQELNQITAMRMRIENWIEWQHWLRKLKNRIEWQNWIWKLSDKDICKSRVMNKKQLQNLHDWVSA